MVFSASWQNLLNAIDKCKKESFGIEKRLIPLSTSRIAFGLYVHYIGVHNYYFKGSILKIFFSLVQVPS